MAKITVKDQVLSILNENKGTYYSGQDLADKLNVSRTAIWKAINNLRDAGYSIVGSTNLGYALDANTDILDERMIVNQLSSAAKDFYKIECVKLIDSTNTAVKNRGTEGADEGLCIIAEEQTAGRGRRGRSFYSPDSTGLYLSVLLRPNLSFEHAVLITTAASVAALNACYKVNNSIKPGELGIKWVNDLYLNGKKISGILTEANLSIETGQLDFAVLGIGFNLGAPSGGWPEDIKDIAGSLFTDKAPSGSRNALSAAFLEEFFPIYKSLPETTYLESYRSHQLAIGKEVKVLDGTDNPRIATVIDVDDKCQLIVKYLDEDNTTILNSGEISIRL